jgi:hypothetical protein
MAAFILSAPGAAAQTRTTAGHWNVSFGLTIEPDGDARNPDFAPKLGGMAPVVSLSGGVLLSNKVMVDGTMSIAREFSNEQRVRLGFMNHAQTTTTHSDHLLSAEILGKVGRLWAGGGYVLARSLTKRVGITNNLDAIPIRRDPYSDRRLAWHHGFVGVLTGRAPLNKSTGILMTMRVYGLFRHNEPPEGLSDWLVYRPTVGVDFRF